MSFSVLHLYDTAAFRKVGLSARVDPGSCDAVYCVAEMFLWRTELASLVRVSRSGT